MIEGVVNAAYEAVVTLRLQGPTGHTLEADAMVDTGFSRFLTLPQSIVTELGLAFIGVNRVGLADDSEVAFDGRWLTCYEVCHTNQNRITARWPKNKDARTIQVTTPNAYAQEHHS